MIEEVHSFEELKILFGEELSDSFVTELASHVTSAAFRIFTLRKAYNVSSTAFEIFFGKRLESLSHLNLDECILLNDAVLDEISLNCPNLEGFTSTWCPQLRYIGVKCLIARCLKLKKLNMTGTKKLTDEAFQDFVPILPKRGEAQVPTEREVPPNALRVMKKLNLESCDYVSDELLTCIKRCYPQVKILNYFREEVTL